MEYRIEHDSMGEVKVPADKLWAAQTERSHENFEIGVGIETMPREIIHAFGVLKKAAAIANNMLKPEKMTDEKLSAIKQACEELDYTYTLWGNDNSLESISGEGLGEYAMSDTMWWRCTINGVEPEEGTAGENTINNNDTVVFSYEEIPDFDAEENK